MTLRRERRDDDIEIWTIDRPEFGNSLNGDVLGGLSDAVNSLDRGDVRAVVVTAAGERIFCGGMDLKAFASGEMKGMDISGYERLLRGETTVPMIAAVNGAAVAGGFELALSCDMVVCAEHARFGVTEAKVGLFAPVATSRLPGRIPMALALELCLTGQLINAARAYEIGLVNRVVPAADVLDTAIALAKVVVANAPLALGVTKRVMSDSLAYGGPHARDLATELAPSVFGSEDAMEGATAFVEKRPARWQGR